MIQQNADHRQPGTQPDVQPGTTPSAFHVPCPNCGSTVLFPFDPVLSAKLDQLLYLEERLQALGYAEKEVAP